MFRVHWELIAVLAGVALVSLAVLTGCAEPAAIAAVSPTATAFPPPATDIPPPPPAPTPAALDFPIAAPTHVDEGQPVSDQNCIDCHTDEETLKAVAQVEEGNPESRSEGEG
jgi:mono/diheme cytochrome c family protein